MSFLLDTNVPSELARPRPDAKVIAWLAGQDMNALFLSVVTLGELRKGITVMPASIRKSQLERWLRDDLLHRFEGRVLPLTPAVAERWGVLEGQRQLSGRPLSVPDAQIAATALEHGLTLVTRNVRDFAGLGAEIVNPWESS